MEERLRSKKKEVKKREATPDEDVAKKKVLQKQKAAEAYAARQASVKQNQ